MSYQKHNYQTGDVLTALSLNEMDEQIAANETALAGKQAALPSAYLAYLDEATYQKPTIAQLSATGLGGEAEIGVSVSVTGITHRETNAANIDGTLALRHGSTSVQTGISASEMETSTPLSAALTVTRSTAGIETMTLSGVDTKGTAFSKSVSKSFYVPKFTGASTSASVSAADILTMARAKNLQTSVTLAEAGYIYFVTDGTISAVKDASTGFGVPLEASVNTTVEINGINVTYHVYRTSGQIVAGTYQFTIS